MKTTGVVLSDLHCGSIYGLLPPDFRSADDRDIPMNPAQQYLWACYEDFCKKAMRRDPAYIVFNGDCIDGSQRLQQGTEACLPAISDQKAAAIEVLSTLRDYCPQAKWYFTQGTEYHESRGAEASEDVANALGATAYVGAGPGRYTREVLDLEVDGVIINFAHHTSPTTGFYRATAADREGQWSAMASKDATKGVPKADVIVRSHVHYFVRVEHASKHSLSTPCWQLQTRFMRKNSVYRMLPDIGGVFITTDGEAKARGEDPCEIRKELYSLPPATVTKLNS